MAISILYISMIKLITDEYIEDLQFNGLQIILNRTLPSFTTDAVLLSDFSKVKKSDLIADFGTGTGIIALLMHGRYGMRATCFEIQNKLCDMASRSFMLNDLQDVLFAVNSDYREAYHEYNGTFSAVVCNPPYFNDAAGIIAPDEARAKTRSQIACNLDDITLSATRVLKSGGKFFVCYPAAQLTDIIYCLRNNKLEPKRIRFVRAKPDKLPYLVLIEARKDGGKNLVYENDLIITDMNGMETDEIKRIYHR